MTFPSNSQSLFPFVAWHKEWIDHIKYILLGGNERYLSVGGEIRYKYENYENPGVGSDPESPSGYVLQRYLLHTDWHIGRHLRLFTQFQSGLEAIEPVRL